MENCPLKSSTVGQLYPECVSDVRSIFWQIGNQSVPRVEVVCPEPHHATGVPYVLNSINRLGSKPKGILPLNRGNKGLEVLDITLDKDGLDVDSDATNQMGFFCGSPPVRTNNPVVHDAKFMKQAPSFVSPLGCPHGMKPSARLERGSPSCCLSLGASPKLRVEGFTCGSAESHRAVLALA